jgi:signal transduction histidine kinase
MSYRAFKRLLGETSLERKCRFLFGAAILILITLSFWLYAIQTEKLAFDQAVASCRLLVNPSLGHDHLKNFFESARAKPDFDEQELAKAFNLDEVKAAYNMLSSGKDFQYQVFVEKEDQKLEPYERDLFREFRREPEELSDKYHQSSREQVLVYSSPLWATKACLACHAHRASSEDKGTLLGIMQIRMPTKAILDGVHLNRAILMGLALATALLIMAGSWIIVRYIIVKPVKHLKEVSDAISAGELNVRSEIQTGDEFEDLSHAFNRMLRNLVSMQDQWRKVNADLDRKVDELAQANMALYESNRLKSDFLATMSHELRTPLNTILGFSDVLLSSEPLTDKQARWAHNIQSSGQKLLALINDILDLAKIEAGKMQVRVTEFSLQEVCEGLISMFRQMAEKKNIDLRGQVAPDVPALRQDVTKLQQVLQNLLSNAIKFTPEGGRVTLKGEADAGHVVLTVADTGVGIAPEEQDLVFQKFRQSGNPLTREHAGTGLGLSIVRELTKLLGGEVLLQSELGRGSTFTVRLPLQLSEEPRLEFDLADERIDLSKAQRVDVRLYAGAPPLPLPAHPTLSPAEDRGQSEGKKEPQVQK